MGMTLLDPDTPVNTTREDSCQHQLPTYYIILIIVKAQLRRQSDQWGVQISQ